MSDDNKPDNVVFNTENHTYDAALRPYATDLGAPVITARSTLAWKNRSITKANHKLKTKYQELKAAYQKMMEEFEYNQLIFNAKFSFEPIVGQTYHLYKRENGESFLSIIAPNQCTFEPMGSYYLNVDQIWQKIENIDSK